MAEKKKSGTKKTTGRTNAGSAPEPRSRSAYAGKKPEVKQTAKKTAQRKPRSSGSVDLAGASKQTAGSGEKKVLLTPKSWSTAKWVIGGLLLFAVLAYAGWQIYHSYYARIKYETALIVTKMEAVECTGVAVRRETVVTTEKTGVVVSTVGSGGKVSKGGVVAQIFPSAEEAEAYQRVAEIDAEIERFESMSTAAEESATGLSNARKQLNADLMNFSRSIYSGRIDDAVDISDSILYLLNKDQIVNKVTDGFGTRVEQLRAEQDLCRTRYSSEPSDILSPRSGYYISTVDGYESLLSTEMLETITPSELAAIKERRVEPTNEYTVGKIADDYIWYELCEVDEADAKRFEVGKNYTLHLPWSDAESVEGKLLRINAEEDSRRVLMVFECTYMVEALAAIREQPVTIELSSHTGLEINRSSLTKSECTVTMPTSEIASDSDVIEVIEELETIDELTGSTKSRVKRNCEGVYIVWGNEVKFKRVNVLYETEDKLICEYKSEAGWLKLYDQVAVNPRGLYDGKVFGGSIE